MDSAKNRRKHIRFAPDPGAIAQIAETADTDKERQVALICNESRGGCLLLSTEDKGYAEGRIYLVKVGELDWAKAELRWKKIWSDGPVKLGFQYLN